MNERQIIIPGQVKSIFDPKSEFVKQLEIYKLKSEIKPRKVNLMAQQDVAADVQLLKELK